MKTVLTSELGEQHNFVSGNTYNVIEWASYKDMLFKIGTKVDWYDENSKRYTGKIKRMILIDNGNVEVDFNDNLGRVNIKDLDF